MVLWIIIGLLTIIAFIIDIRYSLIPNWLTLPAIIIGLIFHFFNNGVSGLGSSVYGCAIGFGLLVVLYMLNAVGGGDVKLFAAYGAIAGMEFVFQSLIYTLVFACIIGIVVLVIQKKLYQRILWLLNTLFSLFIMKQWTAFQPSQQQQMLRFPLMWAVLPAIISYGASMKGLF